jgi:acetoin utilization deacetylase AcuC-like enzyme
LTTLIVEDAVFQRHAVPEGHPERPERMRAITEALADARFAGLPRHAAPEASFETIATAHAQGYIDEVRAAAPASGMAQIEADTFMGSESLTAALHAAGGACLAVDAVMTGAAQNAFVVARPPGHHAEGDMAMGFCVFNNVAIAARHAQKKHGAERVAIVDWDVHHGNGTQAIFWNDPSVLYTSTHQMPLYPGTGAKSETGAGNIFNAPLDPGADGADFAEAFEAVVLPALTKFRPDLIMISAGFDAHWRDPLANVNLKEADFAEATEKVMEAAARLCHGRVVSLLEGGYDLVALADSTAAHVAALAGV